MGSSIEEPRGVVTTPTAPASETSTTSAWVIAHSGAGIGVGVETGRVVPVLPGGAVVVVVGT